MGEYRHFVLVLDIDFVVSLQFEPFLVSQLSNTEFTARDNPSFAPLCTPVPGTTLLNAFSDVARTNPVPTPGPLGGSEGGSKEEAATQKQLRCVLELIVVLWGDLPSQCSTGEQTGVGVVTRYLACSSVG